MFRQNRRSGITLIQLVIVLMVLAMLFALMIPAVAKVREAASRVRSANNLKQIGIALHSYHDAIGRLPTSVGAGGLPQVQQATLFFAILPYVEQDNVYRRGLTDVVIPVYQADGRDPTADKGQPLTSYASNFTLFGDGKAKVTIANIRKGTSNTIGIAERYAIVGEKEKHLWGDTKAGATYIEGPKSDVEFGVAPEKAQNTTVHALQGTACMVGLMDGSVRGLNTGIKTATFRWACDPVSRDDAPADW